MEQILPLFNKVASRNKGSTAMKDRPKKTGYITKNQSILNKAQEVFGEELVIAAYLYSSSPMDLVKQAMEQSKVVDREDVLVVRPSGKVLIEMINGIKILITPGTWTNIERVGDHYTLNEITVSEV